MKRCFAEVLVLTIEDKGQLEFHITSDRKKPIKGQFTVELWRWNSGKVAEWSEPVESDSTGAKIIKKTTVSELLSNRGNPEEFFLVLTLTENGVVIAENHHFLSFLKAAGLKRPVIKQTKHKSEGATEKWLLQTDIPAPYVFLNSKGNGRFDDNGFLLLPGRDKTVSFKRKATDAASPSDCTIRSLADIS